MIVPVLEPNKNKTLISSYRPIVFTNCICNLYDRIQNRRFLEANHLLPEYQCVFRPNHPTMDHILRLESEVLNAFSSQESIMAVPFDIEKAYDTVAQNYPFEIISIVFLYFFNFIVHFLSNETVRVKIDSHLM